MNNIIRVGITQGDLNGIGLEVIIKTFSNPAMFEICTPVLFGSQKTFSYHRKALNIEMRFNPIRNLDYAMQKQFNIYNIYEEEVSIELGKSTETAGKYAIKSIEAACEALEQRKIDVLVTAPINKHNVYSEKFPFKGHTDYLETRFKSQGIMLMCAEQMRVGIVTGHVPLANVSALVNEEKILQKLRILQKCMVEDFGIRKPRIAVLGLNPHAGDNGTIGTEENTIIIPAITKAKNEGIMALGPYSADGFFGACMQNRFDAVLAMYHDQGLIPFKTLAFNSGVNYTAGLPVIRTSPAHGVSYDIAGKNMADESSFRCAVYMACDIFRTRNGWQKITANPLKSYSYETEQRL